MQMLEWAFSKCGAWWATRKWWERVGITGLLTLAGYFSRFMTEQCTEAFLLFGIVGVFFIMASAREKGTKMINLSIITFIIMKVLGACM